MPEKKESNYYKCLGLQWLKNQSLYHEILHLEKFTDIIKNFKHLIFSHHVGYQRPITYQLRLRIQTSACWKAGRRNHTFEGVTLFLVYSFYILQKFIAFLQSCLNTHSVRKHCHMLSLGLQINLLGIAQKQLYRLSS